MGFIDFLKTNENTRKIFGKRELVIIEKQLMGVNLTQSEKNRLSRDIRKKFEFIDDASRFSDRFDLKKGAVIDELIDDAKKTILNDVLFKNMIKIILYGSAVENKLTLDSDIDIAVEFSDISLDKATLFRKRISGKLHQKIDVQVYNHLPEKVQEEIKEKGKIIYEK